MKKVVKPKVQNIIEEKQAEIKYSNDSDITAVNTFDFSPIEDLDPILADGHKNIFEKTLSIEIRKINTMTIEKIRLRILIIGEEAVPGNIRVELSTEDDIFFFYLSEIDIFNFKKMQETQKLSCNFGELIPTIKKLVSVSANSQMKEDELNSSINTSINQSKNIIKSRENVKDLYKLVLNVSDPEAVKLEFVKLLGHKEITVLYIDFLQVNDSFIRKIITYKFNYSRSKLVVFNDRLNYVMNLIKTKNPCLYDQASKMPAKLTLEYIQSKKKVGELKLENCLKDID